MNLMRLRYALSVRYARRLTNSRGYMQQDVYAVSYTHLDVYKRQVSSLAGMDIKPFVRRMTTVDKACMSQREMMGGFWLIVTPDVLSRCV